MVSTLARAVERAMAPDGCCHSVRYIMGKQAQTDSLGDVHTG